MPGCPARSVFRQQALVLSEVRAFERQGLRHVESVAVTDLAGITRREDNPRLQPDPERLADVAAAAARKLAALHLRGPKADALPACVADGLYLGGAGAARNLKALRKRGITHIVNASPTVPCHFRDNPEGAFEYLALQLFDDPDADLLPHIEACNAFIAAARARGAAVLVHCYAGQSRSAALVVAHLMSSRGLGLLDAWALARRARPCAQPNPGFLRQLGDYAQRLQAAAGDELPLERVAAEDSAADLVLTQ